jgi:hypothetical protein
MSGPGHRLWQAALIVKRCKYSLSVAQVAPHGEAQTDQRCSINTAYRHDYSLFSLGESVAAQTEKSSTTERRLT